MAMVESYAWQQQAPAKRIELTLQVVSSSPIRAGKLEHLCDLFNNVMNQMS